MQFPQPNGVATGIRRAARRITPGIDRFLGRVHNIIHIGANHGGERHVYAGLGLSVLWIEPIPAVFESLEANIAGFTGQRALCRLIADEDDTEHVLNIASNKGASSSILALKEHQDVWPEVEYVDSLTIRGITLPTLLKREGLAPSDFDAVVLDTQGSELKILRGARSILHHFAFIKTEVPDFEAYAGCCQVDEMQLFMQEKGLRESARHCFASSKSGNYYDIVYRRTKGPHGRH